MGNVIIDPTTKSTTSIRARKDGNVYSVDKRSTQNAMAKFGIIVKPKEEIGIEVNPYAPDGNADLAARAMKVLVDHYPGYTWIVEVDDRPSVACLNVYNQDVNAALFSGAPYGYRIFLSTAYDDPNLKCVMRAGGEILERARLVRGRNRGEAPIAVDGVLNKHQPRRVN